MQQTKEIVTLFSKYHHHYHDEPLTRVSLTLFTIHLYHPLVPAGLLDYNLCTHKAIVVLAGHPKSACPCEGVHRRTSLMISSLLLQQWPPRLVCLTMMVLEMRGTWPYSCCFKRCFFKDSFAIARSILVKAFALYAMVHPYSCMDITTAWKKIRFILSYDR